MILCCQIQDILSRELDELTRMIILVSVGTPHRFFFENWMHGCMIDSNNTPKFRIAYYYVVKTDKSETHIAQIDLNQFIKIINMLRVGTPQPFIFKNWTQWCMTGLNLIPHFKYSTIICCQNSDIIILDRKTRNRSVHKNVQHVQGWNPTIIFFEFFSFENRING